jgi:hypothetical protein
MIGSAMLVGLRQPQILLPASYLHLPTLQSSQPYAANNLTSNDGYLDVRLAASRNGANFSFVSRDVFLPRGTGYRNALSVNHADAWSGAFTELEVDKKTGTAKPKVGTAESPATLWVLITHPTLESFTGVAADLNVDPAVQAAGRDYLLTPKANPAYTRVDSWLLRAFAGMTKMVVPAFSKTKVATRIFEMRDYESHSEERALNKMAMFDDGEIEVMRDLGMSPLFFGQAIAGPNLPHLRYITCAADLTTHLANWKKFGPDPRWVKMKDEPRYKDNTSKNTARFLVSTSYSQL